MPYFFHFWRRRDKAVTHFLASRRKERSGTFAQKCTTNYVPVPTCSTTVELCFTHQYLVDSTALKMATMTKGAAK